MELDINGWMEERPVLSKQMLNFASASLSGPVPGISNPFANLSYRLSLWNIQRKLDPMSRAQTIYLGELINRRCVLARQRESLARARRLMALWHTLHVPIGLALLLQLSSILRQLSIMRPCCNSIGEDIRARSRQELQLSN